MERVIAMFQTVLIANRGEIACRVIKTCQRLGIKTIAVYSAADEFAQHVKLADEAYYLGPAPSQESYLCIDKILKIAEQAKADAIHPGYGFLSENTDFAEACAEHDIIFIGPSSAAINAMGSKSKAKQIMAKAKVPLIPGYHGDDQSEKTLLKEATAIGFPVLLKAAAGGGGKGMRVVNSDSEFSEALTSAKREAKSSFNDDAMLVEKYLTNPRHIEIQLFADNHGNTLYLFERECSIQRRHQKIIEEAPAANFSQELRKKMGEAAVKAAQAIHYTGAGTVEFLLDEDGQFYFMEMNTRLQVEHPVTELITGLDLVEWQLLVANNQPLPLHQQDLTINGHAIEVRIYAEDPSNQFLPSVGKIQYLQTPSEDRHVRIDSGVQEGDEISTHYDPMIAKLIVWDKDRLSAIKHLMIALWDYHIIGVKNNVSYLADIIQHPAFQQGRLSTNFIQQYGADLLQQDQQSQQQALALACLAVLLKEAQFNQQHTQQSADEFSPWQQSDGWRMNLAYRRQIHFVTEHDTIKIPVDFTKAGYQITLDDQTLLLKGQLLDEHHLRANIKGKKIAASFVQTGNELFLFGYGFHHRLSLQDLSMTAHHHGEAGSHLTSPMPGTVVAINVRVDDNVKKGASLIVVEAMKMEHSINAPSDGLVKDVLYQVGDTVDEGVELLVFEPI